MNTTATNASPNLLDTDEYDPVLHSFRYGFSGAPTFILCILVFAGVIPVYYLAFFYSGDALSVHNQLLFKIFAYLSPVGLIGLGIAAYKNLFHPMRVAFTKTAVIYPDPRAGFSGKEAYLPYSAITKVEKKMHSGHFLSIEVTAPAHDLTIDKNMLPSEKDFDDVLRILNAKLVTESPVPEEPADS